MRSLIRLQRMARNDHGGSLVELALVLVLAQANPSSPDGFAAGAATAIAGTVAVVFGPVDGVLLALAGAIAFGFADDRGSGELAALVAWPGIVLVAVPFFIAGVFSLTRPEYIGILFSDAIGRVLVAVALVMMGCGIYVMKKMVSLKV